MLGDGELLSACIEHKVSVSAPGLEKGMCAQRARPFFPAVFVPSLHKPSLTTTVPTVFMPYMDGQQGFTSGKMSSTSPWSGSEVEFTLAKSSPYLKVWLSMAERVLVVGGGS